MSLKDYDIDYNGYEIARYKYENANVVSKLLTRITGRFPTPPEPLRFAIKYGDIGMPFRITTFHDGYSYSNDWESYSVDKIPDEEEDSIDDLWTVVEYEGKDVFVDLVTGKRFRISIPETIIDDTMKLHDRPGKDKADSMTEGYERIRKMYEGYYDVPLAIGEEGDLRKLNADIKESIMTETVPLKEKITERMERKEELARQAIVDKFQPVVDKYGQQSEKLRQEKIEEERREQEEAERIRKEREESRRKEELARMNEEEKSRIIDPAFNEMFGPTKKK